MIEAMDNQAIHKHGINYGLRWLNSLNQHQRNTKMFVDTCKNNAYNRLVKDGGIRKDFAYELCYNSF